MLLLSWPWLGYCKAKIFIFSPIKLNITCIWYLPPPRHMPPGPRKPQAHILGDLCQLQTYFSWKKPQITPTRLLFQHTYVWFGAIFGVVLSKSDSPLETIKIRRPKCTCVKSTPTGLGIRGFADLLSKPDTTAFDGRQVPKNFECSNTPLWVFFLNLLLCLPYW